MKPEYIHEPTDLQCGQAVLAMLAGITVDEIISFLDNDRETTLKEMKKAAAHYGLEMSPHKIEVHDRRDLHTQS